MFLQTTPEPVTIISTLADLGLIGALLIGVVLTVYVTRRNGKNDRAVNGVNESVIAVMASLQTGLTSVVADQATMTAVQGRIVDGQRDIISHLDRVTLSLSSQAESVAKLASNTENLVDIHVEIDRKMERLEELVRKGGT